MKKISSRDWGNINNNISNFVRRLYSLLVDTLRTSTAARIAVSSGAALAIAASAFVFLMTLKLFTTTPTELLGSKVYYQDINITNRLATITLVTLIFLLSFLLFAVLFHKLKERENKALVLVGYSLLPGLIWLVSIALRPQGSSDIYWVLFSAVLCLLACLSFIREQKFENLADSSIIILASFGLSVFIAPALLALLRSPLFTALPFFANTQQAHAAMLTIGGWLQKLQWLPPLLVFLLILIIPRRTILIKYVLFPVQVCMLLFFCLILPGTFLVGGVLTRFFNSSPAFYIIVLPLFIIGIWDCTRRCFFSEISPFSPMPILALLIYIFLMNNPIPGYMYGDNVFEFGIRLPAFWVSFNGWSTLIKDVFIPYGMWDYAQYLFAWVFTGQHTAAVSTYGHHLFQAFILILEFSAATALLPIGLAFFICLIAGITTQSVILIFLCILLNPRLIARPAAWIGFWIVLCAITPFARIPQGTICVVASLPAAIWQAVKLFRQNRKIFWRMAGFLSVCGVIVALWPFGKYFWALIRLFREFSNANSALTGNSWIMGNTPIMEVVLGNAMLAMPVMALVAAMILLRRGLHSSKSFIAFLLCSFIVLYNFISISYGFSRTDGIPYTRQFTTFMSMLLPLIAGMMAYIPSRVVKAGCIGILLCFSAIWPNTVPTPLNYLQTQRDYQKLANNEIQNAAEFGLPDLGMGHFPEGNLETEQTIKQALDRVLAPDETFLNLTMDGMHYFSSQRKVVTEHIVYYDYPGDQSQLRAINELRNHNVNVTLLEPTYYDMSPSSLRTYYLYRYALLHGLPFEISPRLTLLMPPEYFARIGATPPDAAQTLLLLDKQFPLTDFGLLPPVWGKGYQGFAGDLHLVRDLTFGQGQGDVGGSFIKYALQPSLRGVDAGLLVLDIEMPENYDTNAEIRWIDETLPSEVNRISFIARKGTNIVPLDASPRWLLARSIVSLVVLSEAIKPPSQLDQKKMWQSLEDAAMPLITQGQANCESTEEGKTFACNNNDPNIYYSLPEALTGQNILMRVILQAPPGANASQIFYRNATTSYNEHDSETVLLINGSNEIFFTIPADMTNEQLRFDPGTIAGNYVISKVEAKPLTSEFFSISRALLFQRPNLDD